MEIITGQNKCNNTIGGIDKIYLFPFVDYKKRQIHNDYINLYEFPTTIIYDTNFIGKTSYTDTLEKNQNGILYNQSITFKVGEVLSIQNLNYLHNQKYRIIVKTNNGDYKILGLHNGLEVTTESLNSGESNEDFNQLSLTFSGKELNRASFIDSLEPRGFVIYGLDLGIGTMIIEDNFIVF